MKLKNKSLRIACDGESASGKSLASKLSDDVNNITKLREKDLDLILTQAKQEKKRLELIRQELEDKEELSKVEEAILANLKSEYKVQEDNGRYNW